MSEDLTIEGVVEQLQALLAPDARVNKSIDFLSYDGDRYLNNVPQVKCADGFAVSIQASHLHYCTPRNSAGPWTAVEIGYPTAPVPGLLKWRDGPDPDTDNVFGFVPIEEIAAVIIEHGGIVEP